MSPPILIECLCAISNILRPKIKKLSKSKASAFYYYHLKKEARERERRESFSSNTMSMRARFLCPNGYCNVAVVTLHSSFCLLAFHFCIYILINCDVLYIFLIGSVTFKYQRCCLDLFFGSLRLLLLFCYCYAAAAANVTVATDVSLSHLICCQLKNMKMIVLSSDPQSHTETIPNTHEQISFRLFFFFLHELCVIRRLIRDTQTPLKYILYSNR